MVGCSPPDSTASSTSSKASAEISTPAPKAITEETIFGGMCHFHAIPEPITSADPATVPHSNASYQEPNECPFSVNGDKHTDVWGSFRFEESFPALVHDDDDGGARRWRHQAPMEAAWRRHLSAPSSATPATAAPPHRETLGTPGPRCPNARMPGKRERIPILHFRFGKCFRSGSPFPITWHTERRGAGNQVGPKAELRHTLSEERVRPTPPRFESPKTDWETIRELNEVSRQWLKLQGHHPHQEKRRRPEGRPRWL